MPTAIVWGAEDKIFPEPYAHAYHELIPGSKLTVIHECGHLPHQEKLDEFTACVAAIANGAAS